MRWLVTGAGGMLGRDVVELLTAEDEDVVGLGHADLDIADPASVRQAMAAHQPDLVINCAAWTAVDDAETAEDEAYRVNAEGPRQLAEACVTDGTRLLHVSTDYVFAGDASAPYDEDAETDPRSAYGRTKLAGEQAVLAALPRHGVVVRSSWLYGAGGGNFVATMRRLETQRDTLDVVNDQRGQPTWTADVATLLVALGRHESACGVFHATSSGQGTWFDLARAVFELSGADPERVRPTTTDAFPRPAPRPAYSVLGHRRWAEVGIEPIGPWRDRLKAAFPTLFPDG